MCKSTKKSSDFISLHKKNLTLSFFFCNFAKLSKRLACENLDFQQISFEKLGKIIFRYKIFLCTFLQAWARSIAANEPAAWRGGGFHCRWDEPHTCKIKQNFGRDKAAILPNCTLTAGLCFLKKTLFVTTIFLFSVVFINNKFTTFSP